MTRESEVQEEEYVYPKKEKVCTRVIPLFLIKRDHIHHLLYIPLHNYVCM